MTGQTYEQADAQPIPPLDDRIAAMAQKLCDDHRNTLNLFCCDPQKRPALIALENLLRDRRKAVTLMFCCINDGVTGA